MIVPELNLALNTDTPTCFNIKLSGQKIVKAQAYMYTKTFNEGGLYFVGDVTSQEARFEIPAVDKMSMDTNLEWNGHVEIITDKAVLMPAMNISFKSALNFVNCQINLDLLSKPKEVESKKIPPKDVKSREEPFIKTDKNSLKAILKSGLED